MNIKLIIELLKQLLSLYHQVTKKAAKVVLKPVVLKGDVWYITFVNATSVQKVAIELSTKKLVKISNSYYLKSRINFIEKAES